MWIVKGMLLGSGFFLVAALVYIINKLRPFEANKATSVNLLLHLTAWNLWFWTAFVICVLVGCLIFWRRSVAQL